MIVGDEAAGWSGLVGGFVVPDGCCEGEQPLEDSGCDAVGFPAAVAFEVESCLEGLVDGFNDLSEWA